MKITIYSFAFIITLFATCQEQPHVLRPELIHAEALMAQHPDSALRVLQAMDIQPKNNNLNYAVYCLLLTQANDKNYVNHTSDSTINIAVEYFDEHDDMERRAMAWYYKGRVNVDLKRNLEASECYVKARDFASQTDDLKLRALIATHLGGMYERTRVYDQALNLKKESLIYNELLNDTRGCIFSLRDIGKCKRLLGEQDSALYYYKKALELSEPMNDTIVTPSILKDMAMVYQSKDDYEKAARYAKEAINKAPNDKYVTVQYLVLSKIYMKLKQYDSAKMYLVEKCIHSDFIYTRASAYRQLYLLEGERNNYEQAIKYNDRYLEVRDTISTSELKSAVTEIQAKYDNEKLISENHLLAYEKERQDKIYLNIVLLLIIALVVLYIIYRENMKNKERELLQSHVLIQNHKTQILENENTILRNLELLNEKESQLNESKQWLEENEKLMTQNEKLKIELDQQETNYKTRLESSRNSYLKEKQELLDKTATLYQRQQQLVDRLVTQHTLLNKLRTAAKRQEMMTKDELQKVVEAVDELYSGFAERLAAGFPGLTKNDVMICCLLKLKLKPLEIAAVTDSTQDAIYKRNQRLRNRMNLEKTGELEDFLSTF